MSHSLSKYSFPRSDGRGLGVGSWRERAVRQQRADLDAVPLQQELNEVGERAVLARGGHVGGFLKLRRNAERERNFLCC